MAGKVSWRKVFPIGCLAAFLIFVNPTWGQTPPMNEAQLKALILEVIRENPQVIYESLDTYLKGQRQAQAEQELENSFNNLVEYKIPPYAPWKGSAEAPITIIEFTDFECSFCAKGAGILNQLVLKYPDKIKIVFRHNPLEMHAQALPAAMAAMAAHQQGKFWEYHDLLFQNMRQLGEETFVALAEQLELDLDRFNLDRTSEAISQQISADSQRAKELKFTGTPMFMINGVVVQGAKPISYFSQVIDRLLKEQAAGS